MSARGGGAHSHSDGSMADLSPIASHRFPSAVVRGPPLPLSPSSPNSTNHLYNSTAFQAPPTLALCPPPFPHLPPQSPPSTVLYFNSPELLLRTTRAFVPPPPQSLSTPHVQHQYSSTSRQPPNTMAQHPCPLLAPFPIHTKCTTLQHGSPQPPQLFAPATLFARSPSHMYSSSTIVQQNTAHPHQLFAPAPLSRAPLPKCTAAVQQYNMANHIHNGSSSPPPFARSSPHMYSRSTTVQHGEPHPQRRFDAAPPSRAPLPTDTAAVQ